MLPAVILYDGVCGLCDRTVRFVLAHDPDGTRFRFAALQSEFAAAALARHGRDAADLDTVCLLDGDRLSVKADAILDILTRLGGIWRMAAVARLLPRPLRNAAYDWLASRRYRWFGRSEQCIIPPLEMRQRFIDLAVDQPEARRSVG
ncbi:MAG: DCC1-like thiol-disulfide oxidoreductase family protein [Deltaproteobacteria bacterium]|nr:DCC1-like thiol-disulfide oxidoreductase family protein [Deltaproteobacteria bacterium]